MLLMKQGKKPTRKQKKLIGNQYLDPDEWLARQISTSGVILIHKETGVQKPSEMKYQEEKIQSIIDKLF